MTDAENRAYCIGFEEALQYLNVPSCPYCGSKMKAGYACGEAFVYPEDIRDGGGCEVCRHVPMHGWIKQVLEDWKELRRDGEVKIDLTPFVKITKL